MTKQIAITVPGDAGSQATFGGIPYYLIEGLRRQGADAVGLNLPHALDLKRRRQVWNLKEVLSFRGTGGYQYSEDYLGSIWQGQLAPNSNRVVINCFQLYHDAFFNQSNAVKVFYIDQTLRQLWEYYELSVSSAHRRLAIEKERAQYLACDLVIGMCRWAADSVVSDYGIPAEKVRFVLPGGNIDDGPYREFERHYSGRTENPDRRLRLVFVGRDFVRKGLVRFLDAVALIPDAPNKLLVTVIGPNPEDVPLRYREMTAVSWAGLIDKSKDINRFMETVSGHDVGVLLSTAEAGGFSLREFQMLGLCVLVPNVGGSPEMVAPGAGVLVEPSATSQEIAAVIMSLVMDRARVNAMKQSAWAARETMTVDRCARGILSILAERYLLG